MKQRHLYTLSNMHNEYCKLNNIQLMVGVPTEIINKQMK